MSLEEGLWKLKKKGFRKVQATEASVQKGKI